MSSLKKNYIYNILYQILAIIIPFITVPYISRILGADGLGVYSFSFTIVQYFGLFVMLGVNNYGNRSIAQIQYSPSKMGKLFWEIYFLQVFLGIIMLLLFVAVVFLFVGENKLVFLLQTLFLFSVLFDINWFFFGIEQFKITVIRNIIIKILTLLFVFLFVRNATDIWIYTLIMAVSALLSQCVLFTFLFRFVKFEKTKINAILRHLKPNFILFLPVIATGIYTMSGKVILGNLCNMQQVGFYENAEKLRNICIVLITALGTVMFPHISNMVAMGQEDKIKKYNVISLKYSLFIAFALFFGLASIAKEFVPVFLGNEFTNIYLLVSWLAVTIVFASWASVIRTQILLPYKKDKVYIVSTIVAAVLNIVLNLLLIPYFAAFGVVIAAIVSEFTVALYQTICGKTWHIVKAVSKEILIFTVAGLAMFGTIRCIGNLLHTQISTIIIEIICGGIIYLLISALCFLNKTSRSLTY